VNPRFVEELVHLIDDEGLKLIAVMGQLPNLVESPPAFRGGIAGAPRRDQNDRRGDQVVAVRKVGVFRGVVHHVAPDDLASGHLLDEGPPHRF